MTSRIGSRSWRRASRPRRSSFDVEGKRAQLGDLERQASDPDLWDDPARGQQVTSKLARLNQDIDRYEAFERRVGDVQALDEMLAEESDADLSKELASSVKSLEADVEKLELAALLSGEHDAADAVLTVNAGAGGTESQDWAEMLLRMYLRWAEREGMSAEIDEIHPGEEAGIKSATMTVKGTNAYGLLSAERGVHRLVRISPFDSQKRRHTSFASLDVIPLLEEADEEDFEIPPDELRIDVYRSSGPGGQSVNTTDSAVRITHLPTNIVVSSQNDRSQHRNRAEAFSMLKAKLYELELRKQNEQKQKLEDTKTDIGWGHQIRSYVLDQSRIKDLRTNHEVGNTQAVLDGDLDDFIAASLKQGV